MEASSSLALEERVRQLSASHATELERQKIELQASHTDNINNNRKDQEEEEYYSSEEERAEFQSSSSVAEIEQRVQKEAKQHVADEEVERVRNDRDNKSH